MSVPNFNNLTVSEIKDWSKNNNFKIPSGLIKSDIIQYLTGLITERNANIIKDGKFGTSSLSILHPQYADPSIPWLEHLHTYGWASLPINGWKDEFTDMFFSWLESFCPNFKKDDQTTWKSANLPIMSNSILQYYFAHTELAWQIRELCAPIFAEIWNIATDDLLCSYDGGCFMPADDQKKTTFKNWIHVDQPRDMRGFVCIQSICNFQTNGPEDGGLVLLEKSHDAFNDYMDKYPSEGIVWGPSNINDPLLVNRKYLKICAEAGSMILFDSRTFHCNVQPTCSSLQNDGTPRFRMCTYVSMQPRSGATAKELAKHISMYEKGRGSGHWTYGKYFKELGENPNTYGKEHNRPVIIEIAALNPLRSRLIGY